MMGDYNLNATLYERIFVKKFSYPFDWWKLIIFQTWRISSLKKILFIYQGLLWRIYICRTYNSKHSPLFSAYAPFSMFVLTKIGIFNLFICCCVFRAVVTYNIVYFCWRLFMYTHYSRNGPVERPSKNKHKAQGRGHIFDEWRPWELCVHSRVRWHSIQRIQYIMCVCFLYKTFVSYPVYIFLRAAPFVSISGPILISLAYRMYIFRRSSTC